MAVFLSKIKTEALVHAIVTGTPPGTATAVTWDTGVTSFGVRDARAITIYGKAVTADLTILVQGRLSTGGVVGDWVDLGSATTITAASSDFVEIATSTGFRGCSEFQVLWNATGGGATSQVGIAISGG